MSENRVSKQPVSTTVSDGIAVVMVDRPPVNAIDQAVRRGSSSRLQGVARARRM